MRASVVSLILLALSSVCSGQTPTSDVISSKDYILWLSYQQGGERISIRNLTPILESNPGTEKFLLRARKYNNARILSLLSLGIGIGIISAAKAYDTMALGILFGGSGFMLGTIFHFDYKANMKKAIKAYNGEFQEQSYIEIYPTGIVFRF